MFLASLLALPKLKLVKDEKGFLEQIHKSENTELRIFEALLHFLPRFVRKFLNMTARHTSLTRKVKPILSW